MSQKKVLVEKIVFDDDANMTPISLARLNPLQLPEITEEFGFYLIYESVNIRGFMPQKGTQMPFFKHVAVKGDFVASKHIQIFPFLVTDGIFDCSNCGKDYITEDTTLPIFAEKMDCSYSIRSLDVLLDKLPQKIEELIVQPDLISKQAMKDPNNLESALKFMSMYKHVKVYSRKGNINLQNSVAEYFLDKIIPERQKPTSANPKTKEIAIKPEVMDKKVSGQHIDKRDILDLCKQDAEISALDLSNDDLNRYIRIILSDQRRNGINKTVKLREDGVPVACADASDWNLIRQEILALQNQETQKKEEEKQKQPQNKQVKPDKVVKTTQEYKPVKITKYITKNQLKQISIGRQRSVLDAINKINIDPADFVNYQGPVWVLKDGVLTNVQTVEKENGCTLVQSVDSNTNNDRKRLVWTVGDGPNGVVIVCMGVLNEHGETMKKYNKYSELLRETSKRRTFTEQDLEKYRDVTEVLSELRKTGVEDIPVPTNQNLINKKFQEIFGLGL